jgi:hypothetical protein
MQCNNLTVQLDRNTNVRASNQPLPQMQPVQIYISDLQQRTSYKIDMPKNIPTKCNHIISSAIFRVTLNHEISNSLEVITGAHTIDLLNHPFH